MIFVLMKKAKDWVLSLSNVICPIAMWLELILCWNNSHIKSEDSDM